jgi:hypothetical protein
MVGLPTDSQSDMPVAEIGRKQNSQGLLKAQNQLWIKGLQKLQCINTAQDSNEGRGMETDPLQTLTKEGKDRLHIKFAQINLHHSKTAMAALSQKLDTRKVDIALSQEPWVQRGPNKRIRGHCVFSGTQCSIKILHLCKK